MKNKITFAAILAIVIIGALFVGSVIGQSRFVDLSLYGLVALVFLYLGFLYKFTWQIVLFLVWSGVQLNYGFKLSSQEYAAAILILYGLIIFLLRKNPYPNPNFLNRVNSRSLLFFCGILLLYGSMTFALNRIAPYGGGDYALKNMLKAYASTFAPILILFLALRTPYTFKVGGKVIPTILGILCVALLLNFANTLYLFRQGYGGASFMSEDSGAIGMFYIPIINATLGVFTMRALAPIAVIFSFAFLCQPGWFKSQTLFLKMVALSVLVMGLLGSVVSGGRAAVLLSLMYIVVIAFLYRQILLIFASLCLTTLLILFVNLFSNFINTDMPSYVARPLQYVMVEKGDSMRSIENSSDYRGALYSEAIKEWKGDTRVFLFGRSVYSAMEYDKLKSIVGDKESFIMVNLNSGTCHALLPSVLLQYGILGGLLYYLVYLMIFRFFWRSYQVSKDPIYSEELRIISFLLMISTGLGILIATIGGSWFGAFHIMMILLVKSIAARDEQVYFAGLEIEGETSVVSSRPRARSMRSRPGFA
jgi:hypothetical protein